MSKEYVIEVQTGNIDKAGTDADVYTQLYGERAISSELYLDNDKNNFERGKLDQFDNVFADDVGWIDKIRLFHRNNGDGPGWYVNYIKVTDPSVGLTWRADLNRWLATDEADESIDVTTEVPIGAVTLDQGVIKHIYLGFTVQHHSNQGPRDEEARHIIFTYSYTKGCSIDLSTSRSVSTDAQLGINFFLADANFSREVTTTISKTLGTTEEETYESTTDLNYPLAVGESITVVAVYYQNVLEGIAHGGGVSVEYSQKFIVLPDTFVFNGVLTDAQVSDRVRQLLMDALAVNLPSPLPKANARIPLLEKKLQVTDTANIKNARDSLPVHIIQEKQLKKFNDAHVLTPRPHPGIRTIGMALARRTLHR